MQFEKIKSSKWILILFGISGMAALVYEVTWIRPLSLVFGNTTYAVSTIIASFIFGLAVGSWFAGKYADNTKNPLKYFAFTQLGIGFYGVLLLGLFGVLPGVYLDLYHATWPHQEFFTFIQIIISMVLLLIPTSLMGATLPLLLKTYSKDLSSLGKDVGKLDASNSFGAMIGTLIAGFVLIPIFGVVTSIVFAASINIVIGMIVLLKSRSIGYRKLSLLCMLILLLFVLIPNYDVKTLNIAPFAYHGIDSSFIEDVYANDEILFYKESMYSTILVIQDDGIKRLTIDGKSQCSEDSAEKMTNFNLAKIPFEVFTKNYGAPNNALNIGLACGDTSKALSLNVNTTTIEIDPVIVDANKFFYETIDHNLVLDDARNWLFRNNDKFDIITSEPSDPYINRSAMFSQEFFVLLDSRLSENGIVSQWAPFYEMTTEDIYIFFNTFNSVFPYVYVYQMSPGDIAHVVFLGSQKPLEIVDNDLYMFNQDQLIPLETPLSTDDLNLIEFAAARNIYDPDVGTSEKQIPIKKLD